ncbi:hypothetical protein PHMEG_00020161 [Phytophthora megakarya]|uniref:Retrotransposon gag domain-containing protein n=1 Tax=Phytophthora megakarya TaxID=4795 RepID=A0A225VPT6_9STRA|nr:hypothetical protein PHMEG_00020161 [Phytophthora megakarya]
MRGSRQSWDRNRYDEDYSSSDDDEDPYRRHQQDGVLNEYVRQIEKASSPEGERSTQKIELATHRPLGQIRAFSGLRNKSENSMQWLRGFVYEMKGTRASPDEWCTPFQLSLKDGALHWHRQLPKKTKRTWSLLSSSFIRYYCAQYNQTAETRYYSAKREDKEQLCDYLNRINGMLGTREYNLTKAAGKHEITLCHVKVYGIHELEEMIIEILMVDDRESAKGLSQSRSRSHDISRSKRNDHLRDGYSRSDRRDREFGRRRDDSRNIPRVTFAEGSKGLETQKTYTRDEDDRHDIYDDYNDYDNHDGWNADESLYTDEEREEYEGSADEDDFPMKWNVELMQTGRTHDRTLESRRPNSREVLTETIDSSSKTTLIGSRDDSMVPVERTAICHIRRRRRCKFCKQVHEPGRCEVFQELIKLVRTKVDKKDIAPELQTLLFGETLN